MLLIHALFLFRNKKIAVKIKEGIINAIAKSGGKL
jgi:hypothetical protein